MVSAEDMVDIVSELGVLRGGEEGSGSLHGGGASSRGGGVGGGIVGGSVGGIGSGHGSGNLSEGEWSGKSPHSR